MANIKIKNMSVEFQIYDHKLRSLKNTILTKTVGGTIEQDKKNVTVKALNSISLEINDGDRIGISGNNGAGKSTLLRVLAGIYMPTSGSMTIEGSRGSLISMSAGMDVEATGIENIYLRCYILGIRKKKIKNIIDNIREFSDLGNFLELPLKTYSAGMITRLNFSISTSITPDILIVDEGIGTGDAKFREKALKRIKHFKDKAKIFIMAGHGQKALESYCDKIIILKEGKIVETREVSKDQQAELIWNEPFL